LGGTRFCARVCARATDRASDESEVGASNPGGVREVDRDRPISEEGAEAWKGRWEVVHVVCGVVVANLGRIDLAMLAREITNLAGLGEFAVTGRCLNCSVSDVWFGSRGASIYLATDERVKMT